MQEWGKIIRQYPEPYILALGLIVFIASLPICVWAAIPPTVKDQSRVAETKSDRIKLASVGGSEPFMVAPIKVPHLPTPQAPTFRDPPPKAKAALRSGQPLGGLPEPLKAFLTLVQNSCDGFTIISTFRKNAVVLGSGKRSLHADFKAADYQVRNPDCAMRLAKSFSGGHSIDYRAVNHFHASWAPGSREFHARFAHWKPGRDVTRYANRVKVKRYANYISKRHRVRT